MNLQIFSNGNSVTYMNDGTSLERLFAGGFLGLNNFIFFVNYFYSQNKLFMLMATFSYLYTSLFQTP